MSRRKAIIIGASTGIGHALAIELSDQGYELGVCSRRVELLEKLSGELPRRCIVRAMDVRDCESAIDIFGQMVEELGGVDLVIVNAGWGQMNQKLRWKPELKTIETNVTGFAAICVAAMNVFKKQGYGHLVGISSVAAHRASGMVPAYNASKAFASSFLEGLRINLYASGKPIYVTDIRPGFVDTPMTKGQKMFWLATPQVAARQIFWAIKMKKKTVWVTRRWRLVAWVLQCMPDFIYYRLGA